MTAKRWLAVAMWLALLAVTAAYALLLLNDPEGVLDRTGICVALSTLAVAALFNPLRKQLQARIDRRFSRTGYDAQEVLDALSRSVADQVDVDTLVHDLLDVVDETVVPEGAAVWVWQPRGAR